MTAVGEEGDRRRAVTIRCSRANSNSNNNNSNNSRRHCQLLRAALTLPHRRPLLAEAPSLSTSMLRMKMIMMITPMLLLLTHTEHRWVRPLRRCSALPPQRRWRRRRRFRPLHTSPRHQREAAEEVAEVEAVVQRGVFIVQMLRVLKAQVLMKSWRLWASRQQCLRLDEAHLLWLQLIPLPLPLLSLVILP